MDLSKSQDTTKQPNGATGLLNPQPYLLHRSTAPAYWLAETLWLIMSTGMQTGNRLSFMDQLMTGGLGPPTHRHPFTSEGFYVLEGNCSFNANGETATVGTGTLVHLPKGLPHSFSVNTEEARVVNFYTPASFEPIVMSCARLADERRRPTIQESAPPENREQLNILSALFGQEAVTALPFAQPSTPELMKTTPAGPDIGLPKVLNVDDAPSFEIIGQTWKLLATPNETEGHYDLLEVTAPPDTGLPPHTAAQDTAMYVTKGTLAIEVGEKAEQAGVGSFVYVPAGTPLQWQAKDSEARMLVFHLPGVFDSGSVDTDYNDASASAYLLKVGIQFI